MKNKAPLSHVLVLPLFFLLALSMFPGALLAENEGWVKLPISELTRLVEIARDPHAIRRAPAGYVLGSARFSLTMDESQQVPIADVGFSLEFEVLENEWTSIPLFPPGTSIVNPTIGSEHAKLLSTPQGLSWNTNKAGTYFFSGHLKINALRSIGGYTAIIPAMQAGSMTMHAVFENSVHDISVIPSAGTVVTPGEKQTIVDASIPNASGFQVNWRTATMMEHLLSRAEYRGKYNEKQGAISWEATYSGELYGDEEIDLLLMPKAVTLSELRIDDKPAPILLSGDYFMTRLKGKGAHRIHVSFETKVDEEDKSPKTALNIPQVPISLLELSLPGDKELNIEPATGVTYNKAEGGTVATAHLPMNSKVTLNWNEALPEEMQEELRANANYIHTARAEDGVLYMQAVADYEITRGETSSLELDVPHGVQISRITAEDAPLSDWRIISRKLKGVDLGSSDTKDAEAAVTPETDLEKERAAGPDSSPEVVQIFFERPLKGNFKLHFDYDSSITGTQGGNAFPVPLLRGRGLHRQRGMLALLSSKEVSLNPVQEQNITHVGESQLPAGVRESANMTIAHTYKYGETTPLLTVQTAKPEKKDGRFDAMVNTLVSLSDVTLNGAVSIDINVKSGTVDHLDVELPKGINFLGLTAPSLRTHTVSDDNESQIVSVQFTQELEGQFRLELSYEKLIPQGAAEVFAPAVRVRGAEIQQGRIGLEALSAVEVYASTIDQLSAIEPNELPQQLLLKTTNPILLAYKYVRAEPIFRLGLQITRHHEVEIQTATIDLAKYSTLFTWDGLAVTTAQFTVRNSRNQFLKIRLPANSIIWSAFVAGNAEKPALSNIASKASEGREVLIKIVNSQAGFPVELIYHTPVPKMSHFGTLSSILPRPDVTATRSLWNVYLPDGFTYNGLSTNMLLRTRGETGTGGKRKEEMSQPSAGSDVPRIELPVNGIYYGFEKLYANQIDDDPYFSISYADSRGSALANILVAAGTFLVWLALGYLVGYLRAASRVKTVGSGSVGVIILAVLLGYYRSGMAVFVYSSFLVAGAVMAAELRKICLYRRKPTTVEPASPAGEAALSPHG